MSHTVQSANNASGGLTQAAMTIVNYALGGEAVTAAEFGVPTGTPITVLFQVCTSNSLGAILLPVLVGGNIKLFEAAGGILSEVPTTAALNAIIRAVIFWSA